MMKIGVVGSIDQPISRSTPGGMEVFCDLLASTLADRGHDVTLFAGADSKPSSTRVRLVPSCSQSYSALRERLLIQRNNVEIERAERREITGTTNARAFVLAKQFEHSFDILHDNTTSAVAGSVADLFQIPMVSTLHLPITSTSTFLDIPRYITRPTNSLVAVSQFQQRATGVPTRVIYNGINLPDFAYVQEPERYMSWIGRIDRPGSKGLPFALDLAAAMNIPLKFNGTVGDLNYFAQEVQPKLHNIAVRVFLNNATEKSQLLGRSYAFIAPMIVEESFGLTLVEAMACGTPVVAFARGAAPEVIVDGETGFLVNPSDDDIRGDFIVKRTGFEGLKDATERMFALPEAEYRQMRRACRVRVEANFTVERMVDEYVALYERLIAERKASQS